MNSARRFIRASIVSAPLVLALSCCRFPLSGFFEQGAFVMLPRGCLPESLAEEGQSMPEALVTATIFLRPFYAPFKPSSP
jgi:hypothetical protein